MSQKLCQLLRVFCVVIVGQIAFQGKGPKWAIQGDSEGGV